MAFNILKVVYFVGDSGFSFSRVDLSYNYSLSLPAIHVGRFFRICEQLIDTGAQFLPLCYVTLHSFLIVCVWGGGMVVVGILSHLLTLGSVI